MRKLFFTVLLLCGSAHFIFAQIITITDKENDQPLAQVNCIGAFSGPEIMTNNLGQADLSGLKNSDTISFHLLGYKSVQFSFKQLEVFDYKIQMKASALNLENVVISATKWNQSSTTVPSKVVSLSSKEVEFQNPQTAADLLSLSGKVYIQKSQQGGGSPMIRGFATNRLLYAVDGIRMNTAIFRSGNLQNVINLDPFAIQETEVLFGPASVMYGSDAIGGVMSFQTLTPQLSLTEKPLVTGKSTARYSSANHEKSGHFDVNLGWKKWAAVTSFSFWDFDHLRQGQYGPEDYLKSVHILRQDSVDHLTTQDNPLLQIPSAYSQFNLMQKVLFKPNDKWDVQYAFHFSETSPYGRYDRHNRFRNGQPRYAEWNYGPQSWMMNHLSLNYNAQNKIFDELSLKVALQNFKESRIDRSLNSSERTENKEHVNAYSINLDFTKQIHPRHQLFYGFEYVFNDVRSTGTLTDINNGQTVQGPARYPDSKWTSVAAFLQDDIKLNHRLNLAAGVRFNKYILNADFNNNLKFYPLNFTQSKINNNALTGSIGLVYRPGEKWILQTNFGTAFRSPNVDDIGKFFDSEPGNVTVPNPDLKAEFAYNFDLGLAKVFGDVLKVDLTTYYTILDNAMVRRDDQINGLDSIVYNGQLSQVQTIQNAAKGNVYGLQAGLEYKLPYGFKFLTDLNWQIGKEELDDGTISPSRHAAPFFGTSRLEYASRKIRLQFYANYMSKRDFDELPEEEKSKDEIYAKDANGNNYAPAWYTINIKASYKISPTFGLNCGIENITDRRYRPYSSGISAPGRNYVMSVTAHF